MYRVHFIWSEPFLFLVRNKFLKIFVQKRITFKIS